MTLPVSRDQTATPASPVSSALLNKLQDMIVGRKHPTLTLHIPALAARTATALPSINNQGASAVTAATVMDFYVPVQIPEGCRITAVRASITDNATGVTKVSMQLFDAPGNNTNATQIGATIQSTGAGATQTLILPALTTVVPSGHTYFVHLTSSAANDTRLHHVEVDYDRL